MSQDLLAEGRLHAVVPARECRFRIRDLSLDVGEGVPLAHTSYHAPHEKIHESFPRASGLPETPLHYRTNVRHLVIEQKRTV